MKFGIVYGARYEDGRGWIPHTAVCSLPSGTHAYLISSHTVIHEGLLVGFFIVSTVVVVLFLSGCALTTLESLGKSCRTSLKNGV